jgi:hypothetical protein
MKKITLYILSIFIFLLTSLNSIALCLENQPLLLMPFLSKSLLKQEDGDDYSTHWSTWDRDEYGNPISPETHSYNCSKFLSRYFYNGMYSVTNIGSKIMYFYVNMQNSKLSIEKCNIDRIYSQASITNQNLYKPLDSKTYSKKDNKIGNDIFSFIGDMRFKTTTKIGEEKGKGLDFYFTEDDNDSALCGNFGFNINMNSDNTNFFSQLKNRKYINKYVWTLDYQTEEDGIIVVGTEPHFYDETFFMSQFCTIKAIQNQSPETAWSFKMDEVRTYDINKTKIVFSQNKVDFLVDRGLIIGTDEYKQKLDELYFDELISKKICLREVTTFTDTEKNTKDEYYIYYCDRAEFMGYQYSTSKKYYNNFQNLEFYIKEHNYTFTLKKEHLFYPIENRAYFLIIFKKSNSANNIWKLGEPFFSHFQFTFNQDQKTVGFYDSRLEKIPNDEYIKSIEQSQQTNTQKTGGNKVLYIILIIIGVIVLVVLAYFFGKKLNESRKKRANELRDDDFDYTADKKGNANTNDDVINDA